MEALFAVTPSETIKTKLIDDQKRDKPRFRGLVHGTIGIVREEGIGGIYRGLFPVVGFHLSFSYCWSEYLRLIRFRKIQKQKKSHQAMRQGANSAVRFTTYSTLKVSHSFSCSRDPFHHTYSHVFLPQSFVAGNSRPNEPLHPAATFGIGAVAGLVTVYCTMPLECVSSIPSFQSTPCFP